MEQIKTLAKAAKTASKEMAMLSTIEKNNILKAIADALKENKDAILKSNEADIAAAKINNRPEAMIDRLRLTDERINGMANGLYEIATLPDPIGEIIEGFQRPNGLCIRKQRVPMGVIGIIFEARPNVTADAIGLCIKTGNSVILKGGSEAIKSNVEITKIAVEAAEKAGMPKGGIALVEDVSHDAATYLMKLNGYIDVLIPRGGAGLIQTVVKNATVPVIETGVGNCHIFIDESADCEMAKQITVNAKTSRPAVCNAAETLLVHEKIAERVLPDILDALKAKKVEIRGCERTLAYGAMQCATEEDFDTEFLDYIMSVKIVTDIDEAIAHIDRFGTGHSECIVTNNYQNATLFQKRVDAAVVYVNASTRFTDGGEFGYGAEIGISTQKLHARGPMGLKELTTIKYLVDGSGQIRE